MEARPRGQRLTATQLATVTRPHGRWLQVAPEGAQTSLALVPGDASLTAGSLRGTVLQTTDIDATVEQLREHGVEFPHGIEDMPWARTARFAHPDGNELVLQTRGRRGAPVN